MDGLEQRLIELNDALIKISQGRAYDENILTRAQTAVSGGVYTGPGNDTVIINQEIDENHKECGFTGSQGYTGSQGPIGFTGSQGYTGSQGPIGFTGSAGTGSQGYTGSQGPIGFTGSAGQCQCNSIVVSEDYVVQSTDYYVGVNSTMPVTITLPCDFADCTEIIIKAEMGAPIGNRKITIVTDGDCTIDGDTDYVIEVPYQSVRLLSRDSNWHII